MLAAALLPLPTAATATAGAAGAAGAPTNPADIFMSVLPYAAIIILVTIAGGVVMMISRRKIDAASASTPLGFTLQDLKELRDRGELSEAEYERARQDVIDRARRAYRVDGRGDRPGGTPPVR